ncbi:ribonuclease Oy [Brachionus plicatilis]|uniref:Ribonuclease Oy n=1 Tax=Brachionus plicatilis TaxID=10195 RepID=A0A3M7PG15_BRAPC|nr:ribonuclease Oy [Brachionus plicatilis]
MTFIFLLKLSSARPNSNHNEFIRHQIEKNNDFDYLIFRQIWPASSCMFPGTHTCSIAKNITTWVVHGLWPSIKTEIGPQYCNKSLPFDFDRIKWLLPELLEFWPNLYTNTPLESFWKHEWEKHGTCALSLPKIRSESDYFNFSLSLRNKFDFGPALKKFNIEPDDSLLYDLDKIIEPMIVCYVLKDSDVQYLSQMQICLSKSFELVDCEFKAVELAKISKDNSAQEIQCQPGIPFLIDIYLTN